MAKLLFRGENTENGKAARSKRLVQIVDIVTKSVQYQYSDLEALPLKVAYLLNPFLIAPVNVMLVPTRFLFLVNSNLKCLDFVSN